MADQTPSLAPIDPALIHRSIANSFRQLANYHDQLAGPIPGTEAKADKPKAEKAEKADKPKAEKADKPKADKPKAEKADKPEEVTLPDLTPEEIAADLKAKLVALVGKDRAKAVALLGTVGAKNFSSIPVEKHGEMLRKVDEALNPKAAKDDDDDPLA